MGAMRLARVRHGNGSAPRRRPWRATVHAASSLIAAGALLWAPVAQAQSNMDSSSDDQQVILDTEINDILHQEFDPIFRAAGLDPKTVTIVIVTHMFNAAAANSHLLYIGTDLIERTDNPNELIGVIAHETGHAAGYHSARIGEMQKAALAPMLLTLLLGAIAAAAGSGDAGAALLSSSQYFGALGAMGYSREQEARADQAAITYLEKAGMSAKGLVDFFDNFRYEEVFEEGRRYKYFNDHPLTDDRIELLRKRAMEQPHWGAVDDPNLVEEHEIMKAKLIGFTEPAQTAFFTYKDSDHSFVARYARAIAYYRETETDKALDAIDSLLEDYPNNPYLWELKGQVLFEAGRAKEAEPAHQRSVDLKPDAPILRINLAQAMLAQVSAETQTGGEADPAKADAAIVQLKKSLALDRDDLDGGDSFAWRLLAQAYDDKHQDGMARLATAEERFSLGDFTQARVFALRARPYLKQNTPEWRRATDIVLVSNPTTDDLKSLSGRSG
jgi:predicted Zn-dependent protease